MSSRLLGAACCAILSFASLGALADGQADLTFCYNTCNREVPDKTKRAQCFQSHCREKLAALKEAHAEQTRCVGNCNSSFPSGADTNRRRYCEDACYTVGGERNQKVYDRYPFKKEWRSGGSAAAKPDGDKSKAGAEKGKSNRTAGKATPTQASGKAKPAQAGGKAKNKRAHAED